MTHFRLFRIRTGSLHSHTIYFSTYVPQARLERTLDSDEWGFLLLFVGGRGGT